MPIQHRLESEEPNLAEARLLLDHDFVIANGVDKEEHQ